MVYQRSVFLAGDGEIVTGESYCIAGNIIDRQDHNAETHRRPEGYRYTLNTPYRMRVFPAEKR